jgi:predicted MPP superfamily phosphohydrolase
VTDGRDVPSAPDVPRDRRVEPNRRKLELLLDSFFRPGHWAARTAYAAGLQGRVRASTTALDLRVRKEHDRPALRLAFASDFHAGATTDARVLADAFDQLRRFQPDVLLLGGDFVSVRASYVERLAPLIASMQVPLGKYAVLGNHDLRSNSAAVLSALTTAGVRTLTNRSHALPPPFDDVTLCGLDDSTRGEPRADLAIDGTDGTRIVLMHSPEGLEAIGDRSFDLALCGHTHGGQIALPSGRPLLVPGGPLNRRFCSGLFHVDGPGARMLLVSRGVGCSTIPIRVFAAPEVHLCLIS